MGILLSGVKLAQFDQVHFVSEGVKVSRGVAASAENRNLMQGLEQAQSSSFSP